MIFVPESDCHGGRKLTLQAFVVRFSSGLVTQGLFGKSVSDIHAQLPGYEERITRSMGC